MAISSALRRFNIFRQVDVRDIESIAAVLETVADPSDGRSCCRRMPGMSNRSRIVFSYSDRVSRPGGPGLSHELVLFRLDERRLDPFRRRLFLGDRRTGRFVGRHFTRFDVV